MIDKKKKVPVLPEMGDVYENEPAPLMIKDKYNWKIVDGDLVLIPLDDAALPIVIPTRKDGQK